MEKNIIADVKSYLSYITVFLTIVTFLIGIVLWIMIPKWRNFKNYLFLNIIFTVIGGLASPIVICELTTSIKCDNTSYSADVAFTVFWLSVSCNWTVILTLIMFIEIVGEMYNRKIRRKFLISHLVWSFPLLILLLHIMNTFVISNDTFKTVMINVQLCSLGVSICINLVLYTNALQICDYTWNKNQKIKLVSFAFMKTSIFMLILGMNAILVHRVILHLYGPACDLALTLIYLLQILAGNIYFLISKSNRDLWLGIFVKKELNEENIEMNAANGS